MSENKIQTTIIKYLKKRCPGAIVWKLHENQFFGVAGVPDIFFAYKGFICFFEVKAPGGIVSRIQKTVHAMLRANQVHVYVVEKLDTVKQILEGIQWP